MLLNSIISKKRNLLKARQNGQFGLKAAVRCTLTEWPLLEKPPFAAGPIDDDRAGQPVTCTADYVADIEREIAK